MIETIFRVLVIGIIIMVILAIIGTVSVSFNLSFTGFGTALSSFLACVFYIIPIEKLFPVIACSIGLLCLRITISIVANLWRILPVRG